MNVMIKQRKLYIKWIFLWISEIINLLPAMHRVWAELIWACLPSEQLHRGRASSPPTRGQWIVLRLEHGGHTYTASGDNMLTWRLRAGEGISVETDGVSSWLEVRMRPGPSRGQWQWDDEAEVWAGVSGGVSSGGCGRAQVRLSTRRG